MQTQNICEDLLVKMIFRLEIINGFTYYSNKLNITSNVNMIHKHRSTQPKTYTIYKTNGKIPALDFIAARDASFIAPNKHANTKSLVYCWNFPRFCQFTRSNLPKNINNNLHGMSRRSKSEKMGKLLSTLLHTHSLINQL